MNTRQRFTKGRPVGRPINFDGEITVLPSGGKGPQEELPSGGIGLRGLVEVEGIVTTVLVVCDFGDHVLSLLAAAEGDIVRVAGAAEVLPETPWSTEVALLIARPTFLQLQ